jgi:hypothetical protein
MTKDSLVFSAGVPTAPDVDKLVSVFGDLPEGRVIQWAEIEQATGLFRGTNRFGTVVDAWRKRIERDSNIILGAVAGTGLKVLDRRERCELGGAKLKSGLRSTRRGGAVVAKTDRTGLPAEVVRAADHVVRISAMIVGVAATEAKRLRYPDPELRLGDGKAEK